MQKEQNKNRAEKIIKLLNKQYPHIKLALNFSNALELLIVTILSAQCTDERTNRVARNLFRKYKNVKDYARADLGTLEREIKSCGFYKNKAKNIIATSQKIIEKFKGRVPQTMEELTSLPGVGRKTANIVLTFAFGKIEGIVVDTHVNRLSQRVWLLKNNNPEKIEQDLMRIIPKKYWAIFSCLLMEHGRKICLARKPFCERCILRDTCPSFNHLTEHKNLDRDVKTIRDLIFYQYAKIIAKSAFVVPNGKEAKQKHYGFVKKTFLELRNGIKSWSDITREDWQLIEAEKKCIYCGVEHDLHREHIIPKSIQIKPECKNCGTTLKIHNQVWACRQCNSAKGTLGLYKFFKLKYPNERKFYDLIPSLLEKKYLKMIYNCHECAGTLNQGDLDGDGELTVLDIDFIIHR